MKTEVVFLAVSLSANAGLIGWNFALEHKLSTLGNIVSQAPTKEFTSVLSQKVGRLELIIQKSPTLSKEAFQICVGEFNKYYRTSYGDDPDEYCKDTNGVKVVRMP